MSSGGFRVLSGFPDGYRACQTGPRASSGGWAFPVSRLLPIRVSGPVRVKDRAGPGRHSRRRQASLTLRAAIR